MLSQRFLLFFSLSCSLLSVFFSYSCDITPTDLTPTFAQLLMAIQKPDNQLEITHIIDTCPTPLKLFTMFTPEHKSVSDPNNRKTLNEKLLFLRQHLKSIQPELPTSTIDTSSVSRLLEEGSIVEIKMPDGTYAILPDFTTDLE